MPTFHCPCCRKPTPHKVVMKRSRQERGSVLQRVQNLVTVVFQGGHYLKMEKQGFCRVCNNHTELNDVDFTQVRVSYPSQSELG